MAKIKYSKQRDAIREFLYSRHDHPTAEIVYKNIIKEYPKISLGTVYRNLAFLVEQGEAITVPCEDGSVHFDAKTEPHYHFQCTKCKAISDIELDDEAFENSMKSRVQSVCNQGKIDGHVTFFYGVCNDCADKHD